MSVYEAEPKVPNNDSGRGLLLIGGFLLLWSLISMIWIPPQTWVSWWMPTVVIGCAIGGAVFTVLGFIVNARTPSEEALNSEAHDAIARSEDGADQHDDIVTGIGAHDKVA